MRQKKTVPRMLLRLALLVALLLPAIPYEMQNAPVAQAATTTNLKLKVVSARTESRAPVPAGGVTKGQVVTNYKFIINENNVGNPTQARNNKCSPASDPDYPANCNWPSIRSVPAASPILTQGDQSALNQTTSLNNLPPGNYLISVVADGYKIDGAHFTIPLQTPGVVEVALQPFPLPLGTVRLQVFEDTNVVNGQFDIPGEPGIAGFEGHIYDVLGEVTTDWYGNPLCSQYEKDGNGQIILDGDARPTRIAGTGGKCLSQSDGQVIIPNLGPNRYTAQVVPPNGSNWVQTTTLEGNHDYDVWMQEGATGYDTEFTGPNAEPVPSIPFGYVKPKALPAGPTGSIKGVVDGVKVYIPQQGGISGPGNINGAGAKIDKPIDRPWIALSDLRQGDITVYVGRGNADGTFNIPNVPNSDYSVAIWDGPQDYLLELRNVTVANGQAVDMGVLLLAGWWTTYEGDVFIDTNSNGKRDPGERGLPNQGVVLKSRANSVMERGINSVTTDLNGHYVFKEAYPLNSWIVMEVYNDRFYTTGVTFQADNQPTETTILGAGVDVSVLPVIGLGGRLDWGVKPYPSNANGGIVGTVSYDTTRNELDARFAGVEDYQPGIPGLKVKLYDAAKNPDGTFQFNPDGSYKKGPQRGEATTEQWERPINCTARDVNNQPVQQVVLPPATGDHECIEAPLMGVQFQAGFSAVDGNYGFGTVWRVATNGQPVTDGNGDIIEDPMPPGDYLVEVESPNDTVLNKPLYQVVKEEDVNVFGGDQFVPQIPPPACAGKNHTVQVTNQDFLDAGGSPYEGQVRPLCDVRLVTVQNGRSIAPTFLFFTEVPLPGRFYGLIVDDLNVSTNPQDTLYGEKRGLPNSPIGIYDYSDRLVTTIQSDPNGFFEVLLPSTSTYNCPLPAGPCANVYRLQGNDPGTPGKLNPTYDPHYRTISASFEIWPGLFIPADLAPTLNGSLVQAPGSQVATPAQCKLADTTPQIFSINKPYLRSNSNLADRTFTLKGQGFGASRGNGRVAIENSGTINYTSWTDTQIVFVVPDGALGGGPHQLHVIANNGESSVNGLTLHLLGDNGYNPTLYEVGPGLSGPRTFNSNNYTFPYTNGTGPIQAAIEAASNQNQNQGRALIVVYPGTATTFNALGVYYENLLISSPIKLQGVGPGGVRADGSSVTGTVLDGLGFGNEDYATFWRTRLDGLTWVGNQNIGEGAVATILARTNNQFTTGYKASIDGFAIQGGDQLGQPNKTASAPGGVVITQGGGIFANASARYLQINNNILRSNGGTYAGAIRVGTPYAGDNNNDNIRVAYNRVIANGGTNLAGAIGMFRGADNYEIDHNDICGNYSAEYGAGISHYGLSGGPNGQNPARIHNNRIYFNSSYDEGAGIFIAGELQENPNALSPGSGPVEIYDNQVQANLANDDGGGIRFLMAGNYPIRVYNNFIVNNISTHEGGGIALDDATNVRIYNNTIMKNITTATAATSNGKAAPAGISSTGNSSQLQATLPNNAARFSNPILFNNIMWDNRAGSWNGTRVTGIGLAGDATPINYWDAGVADSATDKLSPTNSILRNNNGVIASPTNKVGTPNGPQVNDPQVISAYDVSVAILPWRADINFVSAVIVAVELPPNLLGNYHLKAGSPAPAVNAGASSKNGQAGQSPTTQNAPDFDIDGQQRNNTPDIGADER